MEQINLVSFILQNVHIFYNPTLDSLLFKITNFHHLQCCKHLKVLVVKLGYYNQKLDNIGSPHKELSTNGSCQLEIKPYSWGGAHAGPQLFNLTLYDICAFQWHFYHLIHTFEKFKLFVVLVSGHSSVCSTAFTRDLYNTCQHFPINYHIKTNLIICKSVTNK